MDLRVISWAPGVQFGKSRNFAYRSETVGKTDVYIIENGIDGRNRVMNDRAVHHQKRNSADKNQEFFWPPPVWLYAPSVRRTETDDDPNSHGSCVASKTTGARNGVSKTSQLVVVKSSLNLVDIAWAFQQIVNDVANRKDRKVVVLLTATMKTAWQSEFFLDARFSRLYLRMQNLINLGAVVVVPSGNYAQRTFFADTVPAVFASASKIPGQQPLPLIAVGAVDNKGAEAPWSQNALTNMVWAPGVKVVCTKKSRILYSTGTGTSFSAAMVRQTLILRFGEARS